MHYNDAATTVNDLKKLIERFVRDREWEKFHTPRNLAESICIEAAELLEIFQWDLANESDSILNDSVKFGRLKEELADVLIYCLSLANRTKIDIAEAIADKMEKNERKYPVEKFKGFYEKKES